jgi:hypothetical protein
VPKISGAKLPAEEPRNVTRAVRVAANERQLAPPTPRGDEEVFMDAVLSQQVAQAKDVRTSGRWRGLNVRIEDLCASPGADNAWWVRVFASLCAQNFSEFCSLEREYENTRVGDEALLAWRARNLLEIAVWAIYAANGRENARRIYEDAGRDINGIYQALIEWGSATNQAAGWDKAIIAAKAEASEGARLLGGIESLSGKYKRVGEAAYDCGLGPHFDFSFKLFSKFAHPTAMLMLGTVDEGKRVLQRDFFFGQGCLHFTGAFNALERTLRGGQPS